MSKTFGPGMVSSRPDLSTDLNNMKEQEPCEDTKEKNLPSQPLFSFCTYASRKFLVCVYLSFGCIFLSCFLNAF